MVDRLDMERFFTDIEGVSLVFLDTSGNLEKGGPTVVEEDTLNCASEALVCYEAGENSQR